MPAPGVRWGLLPLLGLSACSAPDPGEEAFRWDLPLAVPAPLVPADNPMSADKVELGRRLFWDVRLSADGSYSCGTCHAVEHAFTDARARALGLRGDALPRNTLSLANVAYWAAYTWANPRLLRLEEQALVPLLATRPEELGVKHLTGEVLARLSDDADYVRLFAQAFPEQTTAVDLPNLLAALAAFERTLLSFGAPYDRFLDGDRSALSASAQRGKTLFESERLKCASCHRGRLLTDAAVFGDEPPATEFFHNTGLYNLEGRGLYPRDNQGLYEFTLRTEDMGKFRTPSLRNVTETAPYMHDGSIEMLDAVLDHYAAGGRTLSRGAQLSVGADNPYKDVRVSGFTLSAEERADVLAFLGALSDDGFLHNPAFQSPFAPISEKRSAHHEEHDEADDKAGDRQQKAERTH
jgi:cytochrome c peroxidase